MVFSCAFIESGSISSSFFYLLGIGLFGLKELFCLFRVDGRSNHQFDNIWLVFILWSTCIVLIVCMFGVTYRLLSTYCLDSIYTLLYFFLYIINFWRSLTNSLKLTLKINESKTLRWTHSKIQHNTTCWI